MFRFCVHTFLSDYNLIQLNKTEIKNIEAFVKQHKAKIPQYLENPIKNVTKLPPLH